MAKENPTIQASRTFTWLQDRKGSGHQMSQSAYCPEFWIETKNYSQECKAVCEHQANLVGGRGERERLGSTTDKDVFHLPFCSIVFLTGRAS